MKREVLFLVTAVALASAGSVLAPSALSGQAAGETFTATASVKTPTKSASAPVVIAVEHFSSDADRASVTAALKIGGTPAVRQELVKLKDAGYIEVGLHRTTIKYAFSRPTGDGRLVTVITAEPIVHLGAGAPDAKPKSGYDLAVALLYLDAKSSGHGELAPAAKVKTNESGAVVIDDYGVDKVWLKNVARAK
jgi:hypothetical protein